MGNHTITITGSTGFVGRRLIKEFVKYYPKKDILCLIRDKSSPLESIGRKVVENLGLKSIKVDLVTGKELNNLPQNPKLIVHLAAETDTSKKDHRVNDIGVRNFYNSFNNLGSKTHFIYIGTMVNVVGRKSTNLPINENTKYHPTNEYTRTKSAGERFLINKCKKNKFRLTILTPNTIYGKGVRSNSLFDMLKKNINKRSFITRINWPGKSALIHVDDVVSAIIYSTKHKPKPGIPEKFLLWAENLSISNISALMHKKMNIKYRSINLPPTIWNFCKSARFLIPIFENITPTRIYNQIWRAGIIVDNVVFTKSEKTKNFIKSWKPKLLKDSLSDIV